MIYSITLAGDSPGSTAATYWWGPFKAFRRDGFGKNGETVVEVPRESHKTGWLGRISHMRGTAAPQVRPWSRSVRYNAVSPRLLRCACAGDSGKPEQFRKTLSRPLTICEMSCARCRPR